MADGIREAEYKYITTITIFYFGNYGKFHEKMTYRCFDDAIVDFEVKTEKLKMMNSIWQKLKYCQIFMKSELRYF